MKMKTPAFFPCNNDHPTLYFTWISNIREEIERQIMLSLHLYLQMIHFAAKIIYHELFAY